MMIHDHLTDTAHDRPLSELFSDLAQQVTALMRQEWLLARTEMSQKAGKIGKDVAFLALGGAVAYAGFLAVLAAIIIGLATAGMHWWLAALLVGVVVIAVGGLLVQQGLSALRHEDMTPRQTVETLREDARWLRRETQ
jgi:fatty acid desaturase